MGNKSLEEKETEDVPVVAVTEVMTESVSTSQDSTAVDSTERQPTLASLDSDTQIVQCTGNDADTPYKLKAKVISVKCSQVSCSGSDAASNQVRVSQVSKFDWEQKLYQGNLVACNHTYIAYVVRVKVGSNDHVRILNHQTSSRALVKSFQGKVLDLAFAGPHSDQLACVDDSGNVTLFRVFESDGNVQFRISVQLLMRKDDDDDSVVEACRVFWALVVPDEATAHSKTESRMLAVTRGTGVDVFNIEQIKSSHNEESVYVDELKSGLVQIGDGHEKAVTKVVISPEESVLATSSLDGYVKFWQLDFSSSPAKPECLHDWQPHDGEPVTELLFCDNQYDKSEDAPPMWRFLITGTKNNAEIKLWCAVTWNILQTIRFTGGNLEGGMDLWSPSFKLAMDLGGSYLLLSDITRQVLYVCSFVQDAESGVAYFDRVSEFVLAQPLLSFVIHKIKQKNGKLSGGGTTADAIDMTNGVHDKSSEDLDGANDDDASKSEHFLQRASASIHVFGIHTRALQQLSIQCAIPSVNGVLPTRATSSGSSQDDVSSINDTMSDVTDNVSMREECSPVVAASTLEEKMTLALASLGISSSVQPSESVVSEPEADEEPQREEQESAVAKAPEDELPDILASSSSSSANNKVPSLDVCQDNQADVQQLSCGPPDMVQMGTANEEEPHLDVLPNEQLAIAVQDDLPVASTPVDPAPVLDTVDDDIAIVDDGDDTASERRAAQMSRGASLEQSPIKSVNIPAESSADPKANNTCCSIALEAIRAENTEMRGMLAELLEANTRQQELLTSQLNEQRSEREAMKADFKLLAKSTSSHFNKTAKELSKSINAKFEVHLNDLKTVNQDRDMQLMENMTTPIVNSLREKTTATLKEGIKESIVPAMHNMVKSAMDKVNAEVIVKMSAIEKKIKDEMDGFVRSKDVTNAIAHAAAGAVHKTISSAYKEELRNNIIPAFQKTCSAMLSQLNSSFSAGTVQYLNHLETHLGNVQREQEKSNSPIKQELQTTVSLLRAVSDGKTIQDAVAKAMTNTLGRFHEAVKQSQQDTINEIRVAVADTLDGFNSKFQSGLAGGGRATPTVEEVQDQIRQYIDCKEFSKAFERALSMTSLPVVMFTCELVSTEDIFEESPCPLTQPVILSLIQQLSADLETDTVKKTNYIKDAIFALDLSDSSTRVHLSDVVSSLLKQIAIATEERSHLGTHHHEVKALRNLRTTASGVLQEAKESLLD